MDLRQKILLWIGVAAFILLFAGMGVMLNTAQNQALDASAGRNLQATNYVSRIVDLYVLERTTGVEAVTKRLETAQILSSRNASGIAKLVDEISGINERVDIITRIVMYDSGCIGIASDRASTTNVTGVDFSNRDYCKGIKETRAKYVSSAFVTTGNTTFGLGVAMPVKDGSGRMPAFFVTVVDVDKLTTYLADAAGFYDRILILDRYGNEIVDTDDPKRLEPELDSQISREVRNSISGGAVQGSLHSVSKNGEQYLVTYQKFEYMTVVIAQRRADVLVQLGGFYETYLGVGIVFLAATMAAFWFILGQMLTNRLSKISSVIKKISMGEMDASIDEGIKESDDEIGELARAFDRTIASLKLAILRTGAKAKDIGLSKALSAKRETEERLQESEQNYRSLFSNMISGVAFHKIVLDKSGKPADYEFIDVNFAFEQMTGLRRKDIIGKSVKSVMPGIEKDPADWIGKYGKVAQSGEELRFENYSAALKKWFAISAYSPKKGYFVTVFEDITRRKMADDALKESEEKFREIYNSSSDAIMTLAPPSWRFTDANPAALELFNVKVKAAFTSFTPWALSPKTQPDGRHSEAKSKEMIAKAMKAGSAVFDWSHKRLNGDEFAATVALTRMNIGGKDILQASIRDKSKSTKLIESEESFKLISNEMKDGIFHADSKGNLTYFNRAAEEMLGYGQKAVGMRMLKIATAKSLPSVLNAFRKVMGGSSVEGDFVLRRKDGKEVRVHVHGMPIIVDGKVQGATGVMKLIGDGKKKN